jgi:hypothetical protein
VWRPCLALGYCFIGKVCLKGAGFLTELTKLTDLTKWQDVCGAGSGCAPVLWLFGSATRLIHELYKLVG